MVVWAYRYATNSDKQNKVLLCLHSGIPLAEACVLLGMGALLNGGSRVWWVGAESGCWHKTTHYYPEASSNPPPKGIAGRKMCVHRSGLGEGRG